MTGQEVWEVWKENPKKKFERSDCKTTVILVDNKPHFGNADAFMRIDYFLNHDWQPVEQWRRVTFLEAIVEWMDGHVIKSVNKDGSDFIYTSSGLDDQKGMPVFRGEANYSDWYVKED